MTQKTSHKTEKKYAVARGGRGRQSDKSHSLGAFVIDVLRGSGKATHDLYMHPNGVFTLDGMPIVLLDTLRDFDLVWIAFVGSDGEAGYIAGLCDEHGVAYVGHSKFHSDLSGNTFNFKKIARQHGIKSPYAYLVESLDEESLPDETLKIYGLVGIPVILKSNRAGSSHAHRTHMSLADIESGLMAFKNHPNGVIAEKPAVGVRVQVLVFETAAALHTSLVAEGKLSVDEELLLEEMSLDVRNAALTLHHALGFSHHVVYEFVVNKKGVHFIEAHTAPDLLGSVSREAFRDQSVDLRQYILQTVSDIV